MQGAETKIKTTLYVCGNQKKTSNSPIPPNHSSGIRKYGRLQRQYYNNFINHCKPRKATQRQNITTTKKMVQGRGR